MLRPFPAWSGSTASRGAWLTVALCATGPIDGLAVTQERPPGLEPDVAYDTVVVRGSAGEASPFFVYGRLFLYTQLVDSTTVVFADAQNGRLVYADLRTGEGWHAGGGGGEGPGEFGGRPPFFSESDGYVHTAAMNMQGATFDASGELVSAGRYPEPFGGVGQWPWGLLRGGVVVTRSTERPDRVRPNQPRAQHIRAYSRETGLLWNVALPPARPVPQPAPPPGRAGTSSATAVEVAGVHARHSTVVWWLDGDTTVVVLDADGSLRGRITSPYEVFRAFVAADERIWVLVRPGGQMVFDRDLSFLMNVREAYVYDAWGDYLLTGSRDRNDLQRLHLLRRRSVPTTGGAEPPSG